MNCTIYMFGDIPYKFVITKCSVYTYRHCKFRLWVVSKMVLRQYWYSVEYGHFCHTLSSHNTVLPFYIQSTTKRVVKWGSSSCFTDSKTIFSQFMVNKILIVSCFCKCLIIKINNDVIQNIEETLNSALTTP